MEQFLIFLQKSPFNMLLFGLALASGAMLLWPLVSRAARPGAAVGTHEAVQLINRRDAVVLDVRDAGEYAAGHIANARHVTESQLGERLKELERYKSRPIIVSCRTGARAPGVTAVLRKSGFAEAVALRGGVAAWQQAGLPLEK
ncbi:MAG: rhodanese-like domain-containing protein [Burkholderiales bacterium]|nr:rhodanese-like domain-containing protein [Burkholderiales bacterium]